LKEILGGELAPLGFGGGLLAILAVTAGLTLLGRRRLRARFERG
jgi:hypothetical protein